VRPFAFAALLLAVAGPVRAAAPNYDRRAQVPPSAAALPAARARVDVPALRAVARVGETDQLFGVPTFLWAVPAPKAAAARIGAPPTVDQAAPAQLARIAGFYGLERGDVTGASLRRVHDTGRGGVIATYRQAIGGVEVFGEELKLLLDRDHDLVAASGFLASRAEGTVGTFRLDAAAAARRALEDFTGGPAPAIAALGAAPGGFEAFAAPAFAGQNGQPIRAKKVLFHLPGQFVPAWQVEVLGATEAYAYVWSAEDGSLLLRQNLIQDASYSYRAWADAATPFLPFDGPQGTIASPVPTNSPAPYSPVLVPPQLVTLQNAAIPTNDPWLPAGATVTTGNNVDAYADFNAPDGFGGGDLRATTTGPNAFDRTYDVTQVPSASANQRMAAVTQLFFTTNALHDDFYAAGFDEASGNAQTDNYGRGGLSSDNLRAEAQDYSGTNNANMSTPSDGGHPRMQMYVFNPPTVVTLSVNAVAKTSGRCAFGPQNYSLTANAVVGIDGSGAPNDGCTALTNGGAVAGKIVLLDRAACSFTTMALNAQNAGAVGLVVVNNTSGPAPNLTGSSGSVTIPVQSVSDVDGAAIKTALLSGPVSIALTGTSQLQRDGSIDNAIVAHEYGHYVSNRLIGDGVGLGNNQGGGMGEGWGDFQGLLLTVRAEDAAFGAGDWSGCYAVGGYALSPNTAGGSTYYYGVRRYPYSTDMTKNPMTFQHVQNSVALPAGPPINPNAGSNAEVHNTGSVWCTMLWECYASLLENRGLTFDQSRTRMRDYLIAAYKMTPLNPTITEARDALLAVALAADPADHALFCAAFAKRGCGSGAVSPPRYSDDNIGVIESYQCGGALEYVSAGLSDDRASCDADGILDNGEYGNLVVTLKNVGSANLTNTTVTVSSANPAVTFPAGNVMTVPTSAPFATATGSLQVSLSGAAGVSPLDFTFAIADPGLVVAAPNGAFLAQGNGEPTPSTSENVEVANAAWTTGGNPPLPSNAWARTLFTSTWSFFAPDAGGVSDQWLITPALQVAGAGNFTFTFQERHSFETSGGVFYDGGVLEITDNDGASWTDIGASASPGYGGSLFVGSDNPLGGRSAYVAANAAYPNFNTVTVNLGTAYAGKTVKIRWRVGTDQAAGGFGWAIDNLAFTNLVNQPFLALTPEAAPCNLVAVGDPLPTELALAVAGANPARGLPSLRFALPQAGHVTIGLYDVAGRRVALLANEEFAAGWHATPARTRALAGGVYFARMDVAGKKLVQRLVILQ
jgi:hypothetical protein